MRSRNTLFANHVDRPVKVLVLENGLGPADLGVCGLRMTVEELVGRDIRPGKIFLITPAHDWRLRPRRIITGSGYIAIRAKRCTESLCQ